MCVHCPVVSNKWQPLKIKPNSANLANVKPIPLSANLGKREKKTCFRKQLLLISIKINTFSKCGSELEPGKEKMLNQSLAAEPISHKYKRLVQSKLKKITAEKICLYIFKHTNPVCFCYLPRK